MHPFVEGVFAQKFLTGNDYESQNAHAGFFSRLFPSLSFYSRLFGGPVRWLCSKAAKGQCDDSAWVHASVWVADLMENIGCPIEVQGMDAINEVDGPCLFVANHMSTLETFMLPGMIRPRRPVTFVVKKSLTTMPLFGPVMCSRDPIVVGRTNPREDLAAVLEGVQYFQKTRVCEQKHLDQLEKTSSDQKQVIDALQKNISELHQANAELTARSRAYENSLENVLSSSSWKLTLPLRRLVSLFHRGS